MNPIIKSTKILGRKTLNRIAARPKLVRLPNHARLFVTADMAWSFKGGRYYEVNVEHWLRKISEALARPVFYDIGANLGYYSVLIGQTAGQVYSFEPSNKARRTLNLNLRLNRLHNSRILPYGLSDTNRVAELNIYSSSGNNSLFKRALPPGHSLRLRRTQPIELRTLDDLYAKEKLNPPDLIKIDIEGGELAALRGGLKIAKAHRPTLVFEYSAAAAKDAGYDRLELLKTLRPLGYVFYGLSADTDNLRPYPLDQKPGVEIDNVLAIPPSNTKLQQMLNAAT